MLSRILRIKLLYQCITSKAFDNCQQLLKITSINKVGNNNSIVCNVRQASLVTIEIIDQQLNMQLNSFII